MNQTINISLPKSLNTLARQQVQTGYYSSVSEVVRDALRKLFLTSSIPTIKMSKKAEIHGQYLNLMELHLLNGVNIRMKIKQNLPFLMKPVAV